MTTATYPSAQPTTAPACPTWCTSAGRCTWEPLTPKGSDSYDVPLGTWICDHILGDAGELVEVSGREFSHRPGQVAASAHLDPTLIRNDEAAQAAELRLAARQMLKAAEMIEAVSA